MEMPLSAGIIQFGKDNSFKIESIVKSLCRVCSILPVVESTTNKVSWTAQMLAISPYFSSTANRPASIQPQWLHCGRSFSMGDGIFV